MLNASGRHVPGDPQVDRAVPGNDQHFRKIVKRIDGRIGCVASQFDQRCSGSEVGLDGATVKTTVHAVTQDRERGGTALKNQHLFFIGGWGAVEVVAATVGIPDIDQSRDGFTVLSPEGIPSTCFRKISFLTKLLGIEIDRSVSGPHQDERVCYVVEVRSVFIVVIDKGNPLTAVIGQAIVLNVLAGIANVSPIVGQSVIGQVVPHREK